MTDLAPAPVVLHGVQRFLESYDLILCDIWGVLHDGARAHAGAGEALTRYRAGGGTVVLVSNAPRPAEEVVPYLANLGVVRSAWDAIITSGDVTRTMIESATEPYCWLGPERDWPLFAGLPREPVPFEEASMIVCTGLLDDTVETPDDYRDYLERARARDMHFLCANPDLVVERGADIIYCAGAIAEAYAAMGGRVTFAGKPHRPVYVGAIAIGEAIRKAIVPPHRILAVGDALRTDVAGAVGVGIDVLFVARGIHTHELGLADGPLDDARLARFLATAPVRPTAAIDKLVW